MNTPTLIGRFAKTFCASCTISRQIALLIVAWSELIRRKRVIPEKEFSVREVVSAGERAFQ